MDFMIEPGQQVVVVDAFGTRTVRRATTGVVEGHDFSLVRVCTEEEWQEAEREQREPNAVPWPVEDVTPLLAEADA